MELIALKDDFLRYLQFERRFSPHTVISYNTDLKQFISFLKKNFDSDAVSVVDHKLIRLWIVDLSENKISARSINHKITTLKTFFKFLLRLKLISGNPMLKVKAPKMSGRISPFVEKSNMDTLLDKIDFGDDFKGIRNQLIIELFYATGIRLSELTGLKQMNVDLFNCSIKVLGKRNKERIIPFAPSLKLKIKKYKDLLLKSRNAHEDYFFVTEKGDKIYEKLVYRIINNYLSLVTTIEKRSPHTLRHTFATHMLNKGADINAVKELLGHASLSSTQIYLHNTVEKLKSIHKQAHPKA